MSTIPLRSLWQDLSYQLQTQLPRYRAMNSKLAALRDSERGARGFVIGNGPSLNKVDLTRLSSNRSIGCNGLYLVNKDRHIFTPNYYTVEDVLVAKDRGRDIASISDTQLIVPWDLKEMVPSSNAVYINFKRQYSGDIKVSDRLDRRAFWGGTVTFLNLQIAAYLGWSSIVLVGVDHSYDTGMKVRRNGVRWTSLEEDRNHFDSRYFGPGYSWHDPDVARMERAYVAFRHFAERKGIEVLNATVGGQLEVFKRADIKSLI